MSLAEPLVLPARRARRLPSACFLAALAVLLLGLTRPHATLVVPRAAGTVVLAFDVSSSMQAQDVAPNRLSAAQAAATRFVEAQPDSVDVGVVAFGEGGLTLQDPTPDHARVLAAIERLRPNGGTSLAQAIITALSAVVGRPVPAPAAGSAAPPQLGYWGSATIVLLSDGENTSGPDAEAAAAMAASAGVHIETIGVGTARGTTVVVDGYRVATALDESTLSAVAAATNGSYHRAEDAARLDDVYRSLDLRNVAAPRPVELTAVFVLVALVLLTVGAVFRVRSSGRLL